MMKEPENGEEKLFVHDACVSFQYLYPCDLEPSRCISLALDVAKGNAQFQDMRQVLCDTQSGNLLFVNLFWLFFCLKFQPATFSELGVYSIRISHT